MAMKRKRIRPTKMCLTCGTKIIHTGINARDWENRKWCSCACYHTHRSLVARKRTAKRCPTCRLMKPRSSFYVCSDGTLASVCKPCGRALRRSLYAKGRLSKQANRSNRRHRPSIKHKCHAKVTYAIKRGRLNRLPCEMCGEVEGVHGHHDDYSKPLEVRWLCRKHHAQLHWKKVPKSSLLATMGNQDYRDYLALKRAAKGKRK